MAIFRAFQARRAPSDAPHRHRPASSQRARCCVCVPQAMWDSPGLQADEAQAHRGLKLQVRRHGSDACMPPFGSRIGDPTSSTPVLCLVLAPSTRAVERHARPHEPGPREPSSLQMCRYPPPRSRARGGADRRQSSYVTPRPPRRREEAKPVAARSLAAQVLHHQEIFTHELKDGLAAEHAGTPSSPCRSARSCSRRSTRASHSNIQVVAAGCSRVTMERLAHLLGLPMARRSGSGNGRQVQARTATRLGYRHRHRHGLRRDHSRRPPADPH